MEDSSLTSLNLASAPLRHGADVSSSLSMHHFQYNAISHADLEIVRTTAKLFLTSQAQLFPDGIFHCNIFHYSAPQRLGIGLGILLSFRTHQLLHIHWTELLDFLIDIQSNYYFHHNPYHSFQHVLDVTLVIYHIITQLKVERFVTPLDKVAIAIAALCHDTKHPGLNNLYHLNGKTDVASLYDGKSVLENLSASCTLSLIRSKFALLRHLDGADARRFERDVVDMILSTDMSKHFELRTEFVRMVEKLFNGNSTGQSGRPTSVATTKHISLPLVINDRQVLLKALLHTADISNPCRPFHISKMWSDLVIKEFFLQGDFERDLSLPISPNMDRSKSSQADIALGFGDVIVSPFMECLVVLFDADRHDTRSGHEDTFAEFYVRSLRENRVKWVEIKEKTVAAAAAAASASPATTTTANDPSPPPTMTTLAPTSPSLTATATLTYQIAQLNRSPRLRSTTTDALAFHTALMSPATSYASLRRFSVAAGVIDLPDEQLAASNDEDIPGTPANLYRVASSRKISYQISPGASSPGSESAASTTYTSSSTMSDAEELNHIPPSGAQGNPTAHPQWYQRSYSQSSQVSVASMPGGLGNSMASGVSAPPAATNAPSRSRRASVDDQALRRYLALRRNSQQASNVTGELIDATSAGPSLMPGGGGGGGGADASGSPPPILPPRRRSSIAGTHPIPMEHFQLPSANDLPNCGAAMSGNSPQSSSTKNLTREQVSWASVITDKSPSTGRNSLTSQNNEDTNATISHPHFRHLQRCSRPRGYLNAVINALAAVTADDVLAQSVLTSLTLGRPIASNLIATDQQQIQALQRIMFIRQYLESKEKWRRIGTEHGDGQRSMAAGESVYVLGHAGHLAINRDTEVNAVSPPPAARVGNHPFTHASSSPALANLFDISVLGKAWLTVGGGTALVEKPIHNPAAVYHQASTTKQSPASTATPMSRLKAILHRRSMSEHTLRRAAPN